MAYPLLRYEDPMEEGVIRWLGASAALMGAFVLTLLTYGLGSLEGWWR